MRIKYEVELRNYLYLSGEKCAGMRPEGRDGVESENKNQLIITLLQYSYV